MAAEGAADSLEQVEAAFVAAMDALNTKLLLQEELIVALKEGWFNLSRARYHLGASRVGPLQYPSSMSASARLGVAPDAVAEGVGAGSSPEATSFTLLTPVAASLGGPAVEAAQASDAAVRRSTQTDGLRRRGGTGVAAPSSSGASMTAERSAPRQQQPPPNPLHWFGTLVPPVLREAQQDFTSALSKVVEMANAAALLESAQQTYLALSGHNKSNYEASVDESANSHVATRGKLPATKVDMIEVEARDLPTKVTAGTLMEELAVKYGAIT